ncbi:SDR family NAD(P)-dependent oxidoreductase [Lignipirellula cremea]|uniref:3-oxoacyl-[acyl-carrier-protein] reductase FabG n=1 Tax=Lignipirellula cremea TaxID=2528010 RepID=A0A518DW08_9BACT|nr:SDR family NAD(P)-dependent oxidoreductase [Lignipirellula cremea]QDU96026.1 3-oxoacyl-[acyl-carrier-protein] reductase FabG [Lignipirellula cremea]
MQIQGNTFLVTGAASGLGKGTTEALVAAGANVIAVDLNATVLGEAVEPLGPAVVAVTADVADAADVQQALDLASRFPGPFRGVVNCAGVLGAARTLGRRGPCELELFEKVVRVNLIGTFNVCRLAAAALNAQEPDEEGERGVLVNTASVAAFEGQIGQTAYSASKGGIASMTLPMARDLAPFGIRAIALAPGVFDTPMMQAAPAEIRETLSAATPFPPRLGRPEEFAALVLHVIENRMLNGSVMRIDGALRMPPR